MGRRRMSFVSENCRKRRENCMRIEDFLQDILKDLKDVEETQDERFITRSES